MTFMLLASCLSYANSAMNPILYAFLSENFKKSFAKAFTCAANKEVNAHLNVENSANPRTTRAGSSRGPNAPGHSIQQEDVKLAFRQSLDHTVTRRSEKTAHGDEDELEDEEEEEIVELEDSPNAIPMTTRISSYVGSVMSNREQRITHDRQILIPSQNTTAMKDPSTPL